jgi:hypothetical protein
MQICTANGKLCEAAASHLNTSSRVLCLQGCNVLVPGSKRRAKIASSTRGLYSSFTRTGRPPPSYVLQQQQARVHVSINFQLAMTSSRCSGHTTPVNRRTCIRGAYRGTMNHLHNELQDGTRLTSRRTAQQWHSPQRAAQLPGPSVRSSWQQRVLVPGLQTEM